VSPNDDPKRDAESAARARRTQLAAVAGFAVVLVVALVVISQSGDDSSDGGEADATEVEALFDGIPQDRTVLGDPNAPLTMVEFADLQCPFCAEFAGSSLSTVIEDYVRPGDLRLEFEPLAFLGPDSEEAARMAAALAEQDLMWQFVDLFYANQGTENSGYVDEEFLREIAGQVPGADVDAALADRDSAAVDRILARAQDSAGDAGIESTPSFLLGPSGDDLEVLEVSSLEPEAFTDAIDSRLAQSGG
jgi:protein-disulfide isomerase